MPYKCPIKRKECEKASRKRRIAFIRERKRAWRKNNPIKMKANKTNLRAIRRGADKKIPVKKLEILLIKAKGRCSYCGEIHNNIGFDHKVPLTRGGKHSLKNMAICCTKCNQRKYNKTIKEFKEHALKKGYALII